MSTLLLIFATAFVFAVSATPLARGLALRTGTVDQPSPRKIHSRPMPLLGGVAIYLAFVLALIIYADQFFISQVIGIFIGATWVSFLGVWDDRVGLSASVKLLGQLLGALILLATGIGVDLFHQPMLDGAITALWIVGITNAMNLLDNTDGLSGGVAAIAAAFFLLIASLNGQFLVGSLSAAMLGAAVGFLVYNFNPASIFMGDTGSLFIGFILAVIGIKVRFPAHPLVFTWFIPLLVLGVPIFDTTLVVLSRARLGRNPFITPGTDHFSHRMIARGWSRREAVLVIYLVAGALGVLGLFSAQAGGWENYLVLSMAALGGLAGLWKLEFSANRKSDAG